MASSLLSYCLWQAFCRVHLVEVFILHRAVEQQKTKSLLAELFSFARERMLRVLIQKSKQSKEHGDALGALKHQCAQDCY